MILKNRNKGKPAIKTFAARLLYAALVSGFFASGSSLTARPSNTVSGETRREYYEFLFLFDKTTAPGQSEWILHPFASRYYNAERDYSFTTFLYPIFYSHGTYRWNHWTFLYLFSGDDMYHDDSGTEEDNFLTPLLYWGTGDTEKDRYFSIFPFFGTIRNKLSYSEISYVMFPLYSSWSHKDYSAHGILWPIVMWGSGSARSDFRLFPFFSRKVHTGVYERYSVLWPFIQWGVEGLDKKDPRHTFFLFPLYGRKWDERGQMTAHTVLWPLFSWGHDDATNGFDINLFWFLFQYQTNDDPLIRKFILFPFYGKYVFGSKGSAKDPDGIYSSEYSFITPLYAHMRTSSALLESNAHYVIPIVSYDKTYYRKEREIETYWKIWPFFSTMRDSNGSFEFRALSLWPTRSDEFERIWGPLYSIVNYSHYENDDRYFSLLFRLYSRRWNDEEEHHFVLGFNFDKTPESTGLEFLGGFLGFRREYTRMETSQTKVRLLWFTF